MWKMKTEIETFGFRKEKILITFHDEPTFFETKDNIIKPSQTEDVSVDLVKHWNDPPFEGMQGI